MNIYGTELQTARALAYEAGTIMRRYFDGDQHIVRKTDGSPVTAADLEVNEVVLQRLGERFPQDGVVGEEASSDMLDQPRLWFCDPVDGTKAFTWGTPTAMFSLALVDGDEPVIGVAYDPFLDRLYHAVKGGGSFCNDAPLHVNDTALEDGTVVISSRVRKLIQEPPAYARGLAAGGIDMATFSGAVYKSMLVAKGRMVGYVEEGVGTYDMAAAHLIVTEAGGRITGIDGAELDYRAGFRGAIVSNGLTHERLVAYAAASE